MSINERIRSNNMNYKFGRKKNKKKLKETAE